MFDKNRQKVTKKRGTWDRYNNSTAVQRSIDARFKQWMNFETCTCQKYTESVQIQWIKKNNYINKGNVSSLMKIVKTADDSYVGLLRLSQHKHKISSMENCRLTKRSTKRFVDGGHKNAFVITNE